MKKEIIQDIFNVIFFLHYANHFFQVYVLMSYFRHKMFPCVYTLINCKTQVDQYSLIFCQ